MTDVETVEPAPEFAGEAERENHVRGLVSEKAAYDKKVEGLKARGDDAQAKYYAGRGEQVAGELKRLGAEAEKPSARAERR
jgi:hypothetical protein